ncbi:MAG: ABC transporter substrate-binding protein [Streptococcaceae bacterium]|jgi:multiple sugar transport system substrate-binding protein|nr:ABC transporter substrate-binding protein [Streptococcaceae bacterium]
MKTWKKLSLASAVALSTLALTACSSTAKKETVTLTYANWNLGTKAQNGIERQLIAAWNKSHPDVQVTIDEKLSGASKYVDTLSTEASAGKLPDVFMSASVSDNDTSGWAYDLTKIEGGDTEFNSLSQAVKSSTLIKGKNVAVPFGESMMGFFVNNDLLNQLNLTVPTEKTSVSDWVNLVKKSTNLSQKTVGVSEAPSFADWMPGEINSSVGMFTYANGKVNLADSSMSQAMSYAADLGKNGYSFAQLTADQQKTLSGGTDANAAFKKGEVAFLYNGTYAAADLQSGANFNYSFMGLPGGREDLELDYTMVSKNTKHAQDAYDFAKYMAYGETGYKERLALTKKAGTQPAYLPLTANKTLLADYWKLVSVPGMSDVVANTDKAMVDPIKTVPGYINARWAAATGLKVADKDNATIGDIVNAAGLGQVNWSDYASQLQTLSQKQLDDASAKLK